MMKKIITINLLILITLYSCSNSKAIHSDNSVFQVKRPSLQEVNKIENKINSKEIFKSYSISLSDQYFPGIKNFDFAQPKLFERKKFSPNPVVSYFYTKNDSIVRLIEYSWDNLKNDELIKSVYKKNTTLFNDFFKKEGKLITENEPTYWQKQLAWENDEIYVFQFILGNNKIGAYRTRLIIRWK